MARPIDDLSILQIAMKDHSSVRETLLSSFYCITRVRSISKMK